MEAKQLAASGAPDYANSHKRERVDLFHAIKDKDAKRTRRENAEESKKAVETDERKKMQEEFLHRNFQNDEKQWLQPFFVDGIRYDTEWAELPMSTLRYDAWEIAIAYYEPNGRLYGIWGYALVHKLMRLNRFQPPVIRVHKRDVYSSLILPSPVAVSMDFVSSIPGGKFAAINPFALGSDPVVRESLLRRVDIYTEMRMRHDTGVSNFQLVDDECVSRLSSWGNREVSRYLSLSYFLWSALLIRADDPCAVVPNVRSFHRTATCVSDHASTDELLVSDRECSQMASMILMFERVIHEKWLSLSLYESPGKWVRFLHSHAAGYGISVLGEFSKELPLEARRFNGSHSQWYRVPWTLAEPMVSKRMVYMDKGCAYVPSNLVLWVIRRVFAFPDFGSMPFPFTVAQLQDPQRLELFREFHRAVFSPFAKALVWTLPKTAPRLVSAAQPRSSFQEEEDIDEGI